ncbi:hypothetical protein [Butyrivibrio sp. MC2021]|uniref:hypothetical protein n=1 Tax=Butyrivibrio sp. MC2021 TaxID=1408306 RepID=UPI00047B1897|nr:hypothetical protein [Butyrivibrio sp. MC2021]
MDTNTWVFNFSGIYDYESFYLEDKGSFHVLDMKGISGTNCMCDDEAVAEIQRIIEEEKIPPGGIRFIDSGNYHYMSAILAKQVKEPFSLVVLDHHPDMQPPMFGDILSCGGWVKEVLDKNEFVRDVHIIGADRELIEKLEEEDRKRAFFYDIQDVFKDGIMLPNTGYPVYLSIDKDVVTGDELVTNWDQGEMETAQLCLFVKEILAKRNVIAVDICGECATDQEGCDIDEAIDQNDSLNKALLECAK